MLKDASAFVWCKACFSRITFQGIFSMMIQRYLAIFQKQNGRFYENLPSFSEDFSGCCEHKFWRFCDRFRWREFEWSSIKHIRQIYLILVDWSTDWLVYGLFTSMFTIMFPTGGVTNYILLFPVQSYCANKWQTTHSQSLCYQT